MKKGCVYASIIFTGIAINLSGCGKEPKQDVSFAHDIRPIIDGNCIKCHAPGGQGYEASGLNMQTYETLMKGTKFGPVIKPGDAVSSTLVILVEGKADPSINMPHGNNAPLSADQVKQLKEWINQGAKNN